MVTIIIVVAIAAVAYYIYYLSHGNHTDSHETVTERQPPHFELLDENGDPIKEPKVKVVIGGGDSDVPVQELEYFCIKDKGYHVTVWPKDYSGLDVVSFGIAGIEYRGNLDDYLGEFVGTLQPEPTNEYDPNAIKVLAPDGHHVGYVPRDMTSEVRNEATLPCPCYCYIGKRNEVYFSECYIMRKE